MTAAAAGIDTPEIALLPNDGADALAFPVAAATTIFAGTLVATDASGNAVPASASSAVKVWGRCEATQINTVAAGFGVAGQKTVHVKPGIFPWTNGDAITAADAGKPCYAGDDNTVFLNPSTATVAKTFAGIIYGLTGTKVRVGSGPLFGCDFMGGSSPAVVGALPAFAAAAMAPAASALINGVTYDVPTTAANSTISLPAASPIGTTVHFAADGTKNGHTVQYLDATGAVALTAAFAASKRHRVTATKISATVWAVSGNASP